ncbi:AP-4 complex accessory subunit tepsin-like isoform X2 [Mercenaria mercenaria]|uniref:AP-4 complex accessory subunit tepsin-like isoform X2 n=1 Tax=Mercenaria mercenaria TaxID=6596 RepID=UPI00234F571A|nr:AP-4 complex accessory subunit tepsin-like isoform X2 [Mercenaria mercenaria]
MSSQFLSKVSFVSKLSVLMKATSDDDTPIPGYIYNEVSKISLESEENCETLVDFLVERLEKDSTHVKIKVLKLMKYVVENGHPNFRLGLLKKSTGIKEATKHSGPPDPLHGSVPYQMVRKTAQSLSEMLFNMDTANTGSRQEKPQISSYGIGSGSQMSKQSRMEGFGNTPSTRDKTLGESIKDGIFGLVEHLGETTDDQQRELLSAIGTNTGYVPPRDNMSHDVSHDMPAYSQVPATTDVPRKQALPPKHIPGKAGGGWDDSDDDDVTDDVTDDVIDEVNNGKQTTKSDTSSSAGNFERLDSSGLLEFTAEQNLVSSYIDNADNGSSILLKRAHLKSFLKECSNLNCDKVVEVLNIQLSSSSDQAVMRSLMLIETLLNSDLVNLDRLTSVCKDGLVAVVTGRNGQIKSKSKKLIRILEKLSSHHSIFIDNPQIVDVNS